MPKRKAEYVVEEDNYLDDLVQDKQNNQPSTSKHTLDSDEEDDSGDDAPYNVLDDNEIDGEEDGIARTDGEVKITPFNMKEEMEEGHFDVDGHYLWKKTAEVKDHWLDNIDWVKLKNDPTYKERPSGSGEGERGLADSDSDEEDGEPGAKFDDIATYRQMLELMEPKETVKRALQRLGKGTARLTTAQRWKLKKAGKSPEEASGKITKLTALSNDILTNSGNMDVYEETFEMIQKKVADGERRQGRSAGGGADNAEELDMYADDFDSREKHKLGTDGKGQQAETSKTSPGADGGGATAEQKKQEDEEEDGEKTKAPLMWEYKEQQDAEAVHGPFTTEQMQKYADEGRFSSGAFVRKVAEDDGRFYSAARIDFDLYL